MSNTELIDQEVIDTLTDLGDQEFLIELVDIFLSQSEGLVQEMKQAAKEENVSELLRASHKLKGSCLNLGAKGLGDICQTLESMCHKGDISDANRVMEPLDSVYQQTCEALSKLK